MDVVRTSRTNSAIDNARQCVEPSDPPDYFNFAEDVVRKWADDFPDRLAVLSVDENGNESQWSFAQIQEQSCRLAHVLRANGLARGEIALVMPGSLPLKIISQLAVMKTGGVSLLLRHRSTAREIRHHIDRAMPRLAIAGPEDAEKFPPEYPLLVMPSPQLESAMLAAAPFFEPTRTRSDEPVHIVLTSGTTGPPKMVLHTHASKMFYYLRWTVSFEPDDLSWDFSGRWWMGAWRHGTPVFERVIPAENGPKVVLETLTQYPITRLMAPARLYSELVRHDLTAQMFRSLRACWSSGHALDPTVFHGWKKATGIPIYDRYGQSECGEAPVRPADADAWRAGCIGKPFPWIDMAVINREGQRVAPGELGEIAIKVKPNRPASLFREYWRNPEATAARHRGDWYLTGDIGRMDQAGFFFIAGRADDVIICGAENIGPFELESILLEHAAVRDVAVVGKPDPELGEIPKAFVVVASNGDSAFEPGEKLANELIEYANQAIHHHKRLREVEFTASLPRTEAGKIRRRDLRELERKKSRNVSFYP